MLCKHQQETCQIQTVKEVVSLNDLMKLEGGGGTRNYEGQRLFRYLIRRFSQLEKGEKRNSDERESSKMGLKKARQEISRLFQKACTILRNMTLSKKLSGQTYTTYDIPSYHTAQTYPLVTPLMAHKVTNSVI